MPITVDGNEVFLPKSFGATLMNEAFEQSVVGRLTGSEPIPLGEKVIPVYEGGIEAGAVAEGAAKPVSNPTMSSQTLSPVKVATIVLVSKEAARLNPGQMLSIVQQDLRQSISRAVDMMVLHGKDGRGVDIASQAGKFVFSTTNSTELTTAPLADQLISGWEDLVDAEPNGFAFDPRFKGKVLLAKDSDGNYIREGSVDLSADVSSVLGVRTVFGRTVAGRTSLAAGDATLRGVLGDWSKVRWGYAESLEIQRSNEATITDGATTYHLFQQNLTALLVEATIGATVLNPTANFSKYVDAVA